MWGSASGRSGERFAHLPPEPMLEVVEVLDAKAEWYRSIADAAQAYDGTESVRETAART